MAWLWLLYPLVGAGIYFFLEEQMKGEFTPEALFMMMLFWPPVAVLFAGYELGYRWEQRREAKK